MSYTSVNWIQEICNGIKLAFATARPPMPKVPAVPLQAEASLRPGLSATVLTSNIISRLPDIGIPTGPNPDGSRNVINDFVRIMCEEIVDAIKNDSLILATIPKDSIKVKSEGASAGGPVTTIGQNTAPSVIKGIMQ